MKFEKPGTIQRAAKVILDPLANYTPPSLMRYILKATKCELAELNWRDPGGWETMVVNYENRPKYLSDKILISVSTMGMALRNRRILVADVLTNLINNIPPDDPGIVCLGAGPGIIINDALKACNKPNAHATLVDTSVGAIQYGEILASLWHLDHRMEWIRCDILDTNKWLVAQPDIVKMIGICEYLTDAQIRTIVGTLCAGYAMPVGAKIVVNSVKNAHGNDRFFRKVLGVNLRYRTPQQIIRLLDGFEDFNIVDEPTGVFSVITATRRYD